MAAIFGWNSLDAVSTIHNWAEILGIAFLALLVVAEIVAFTYGHRKETLSAIAEERRTTEWNQRLTEVRRQQEQRVLTPEQHQSLVHALSPYRGQKVSVACVAGDERSRRFGEYFLAVFKEATWDLGEDPPQVHQALYDKSPVDIEITVNQGEAETNRAPEATFVLFNTLEQIGFKGASKMYKNAGVAPGHIEVRIGEKRALPQSEVYTQ